MVISSAASEKLSAIVSGIALVIILYMVITPFRGEKIDMKCLDKMASYLFYGTAAKTITLSFFMLAIFTNHVSYSLVLILVLFCNKDMTALELQKTMHIVNTIFDPFCNADYL